ncbi:hypothetical protein F4703DRAFT_1758011 [Phycomyces blakesleeanus]
MAKFSLERQSYEVPNSKQPGQSPIYRNGERPVVEDSFSPNVKTIYDIFYYGFKLSRDRPCLGVRKLVDAKTGKRGAYEWQTYREVSHRVDNFGSGLMNLLNHTLNDARTKQIPIGIWAVNRPEWMISDLACAAYGLHVVALYDTLGPETVEFVVNHSELETVICSADHVADLLKLRHRLPNLKAIISMDTIEDDVQAGAGVVSKSAIIKAWAEEKNVLLIDFAALEAAGKKNRRSHNLPKPEDMACIMYTSGTTGMPKGAMLSHRNFVAALSASVISLKGSPEDIAISYLPLAHIFGRVCDMTILALGGRVGYFSGSIDNLVEDIQELKPSIMATVPRLLNRIYAKIVQGTTQAPGAKGALARRAVATKLENLENGGGYTHAIWDRLMFNKVKMALGGNVRLMITGSAPIGKDVMQFLRIALVCDIREGYGATETTAATCIHYANEYLAGHIGGPFTCNELKLLDVPEMDYLSTDPQPRGELCVRGPSVFMGYYKDEEKTRESIDSEGWFHTGDIATINHRGAFVIIDRKKNIFKLAQGEYIAPEKIENVYAKEPVVGQIYVHGDSLQSQLVGIVVPDPETLASILSAKLPQVASKKLSFAELCNHPQVNALVLKQLTRVGKEAQLRGFEQVRAIHLQAVPFSIENELLTPTFKVKRPQAKKFFEKEINDMYNVLNSQPDTSSKL